MHYTWRFQAKIAITGVRESVGVRVCERERKIDRKIYRKRE